MSGRLYELRTYTTHPGRLEALHQRFKNHTIKLFEKHGMKNGMYWVPTDEKLSQNTLIYVVSHDSADAAKKSWDAFRADPEWIAAKEASEKSAGGSLNVSNGVKSVFLQPVDFSPTK